ncbi:MAG: hypothetical protein ABIN01_09975 [Ferruginibacter sp.]
MKIIFSIMITCLAASSHVQTFGQKKECGTRTTGTPLFINNQGNNLNKPLYTLPYLIKIYVTVFANNDGSNVAASDTAIMRQITHMKNFYAAHNICFILAGIQHINSTDLNDHNTDTEGFELALLLVGGSMNIFVHQTLKDNSGALNGSAYTIPNYILSIAGSAISSTTNLSTLSHEMGHDFGLYHTFETWDDNMGNPTKAENVSRNVPCTNCALNGDLLCDTEADRDEGVDGNCNYTGTMRDSCGVRFAPNTNNIMTYGNRVCRNFFTAQQGSRARAIIETTPEINTTIAPDNVSISQVQLYNTGRHFIIARNQINITVNSFQVTGTANVNINGQSVLLRPGVRFTPSVGGGTFIRANTLCN